MANIPIRINVSIKRDEDNPDTFTTINRYSLAVTVEQLKGDILALLIASVPNYDPSKGHLHLNISSREVGDTHAGDPLDQDRLRRVLTFYQVNSDTLEIIIDAEVTKWPKFPRPFDFANYGDGFTPKMLREIQMIRLSGSIRRKPDWYTKMKNPDIISKWKAEALAQGCTENQVSYVLQELEYYASLRNPTTGIQVSDVDLVWHSDNLIDDVIKNELMEGIELLEDIPEVKRDWHPGSNRQVWDLVHPSLYPLVYGKTRSLPVSVIGNRPLGVCGVGEILEPPVTEQVNRRGYYFGDADYSTSTKFSWLPSEFGIGPDGTVSINSYINNLHPTHHHGLYSTLEKIFGKFLPVFERVLNDQIGERENRIPVSIDWYSPEEFPNANGLDSEDDNYDEEYQFWSSNRPMLIPDAPSQFVPPTVTSSGRVNLLGEKVQIIVKLANIILTPENPTYPGGVWHVEGMKNENIVATGIYYYDVSNISESELGFRQNISEPAYEQNDDRGVSAVYGLGNEDPLNQLLGSVLTCQDRCLAFPNIYQHSVKPFKLIDPTRPGHRKILVFFLVNPGKPITSTLTVPPQQLDWYVEELVKVPPFNSLPVEIVNHIVQFLDWPLSIEKAKELRQELMDERKYFISKNNENYFERPFSLCEH